MNKQQIFEGSAIDYLTKQLATETALLIYSPTSATKVGGTALFQRHKNALPSSIGFCHTPIMDGYTKVIGFGGGTAIDIAKNLAHLNNLPCVAVPSMLSTNVFATDKVAVITDGKKHTEQGILPTAVVYDTDLLSKSDTENLYGLADAFSIRTALIDWKIADVWGKEDIREPIYNRAQQVLNDALSLVDIFQGAYPEINKPLRRGIFEVLKQAGYVTNDYGNGRPESGSEHIIASRIEELVKVPHAIAVAAGISIVSQLQGNYSSAVKPLKDLGVFDAVKKSSITPSILEEALRNTKPRPGRFTVLDKCFNRSQIGILIQHSGLFFEV